MRSYFLVFLVETGFSHVGQAALELLTTSDLPSGENVALSLPFGSGPEDILPLEFTY